MSVSQTKSWNPATQRVDYRVYNEYQQTDAQFVKNYVGIGGDGWYQLSENPIGRGVPTNKIMWTVTDVCQDGKWVEFTHNISKQKKVEGALGLLKRWGRL